MSAMIEDDVQLEQIEAQVIPTPLCDEDEPAHSEVEVARDDASGEDVEAHGGGGGFNQPG